MTPSLQIHPDKVIIGRRKPIPVPRFSTMFIDGWSMRGTRVVVEGTAIIGPWPNYQILTYLKMKQKREKWELAVNNVLQRIKFLDQRVNRENLNKWLDRIAPDPGQPSGFIFSNCTFIHPKVMSMKVTVP